jgi:hypothetical protein
MLLQSHTGVIRVFQPSLNPGGTSFTTLRAEPAWSLCETGRTTRLEITAEHGGQRKLNRHSLGRS